MEEVQGEGVKEVPEGNNEPAVVGEAVQGETGDKIESEAGGEQMAGEQVGGEHVGGEHVGGEQVVGEQVGGEQVGGEQVGGEQMDGEHLDGEFMEGEFAGGEHFGGEHLEGEHLKGEHMDGEHMDGEHMQGEGELGEQAEGEEVAAEEKKEEKDEYVEEEGYVEEPPPDPAAPYNFSDSSEALKEPFELRPDQVAELEQLWEIYQNYTPAYTDIDNYVTEKELVYLLKCLLIYPFTEEQLQELIEFCVRPPHPKGHITFDEFVKIVKLRQRDFPQEEELRLALLVFDPEKTGLLDRDYFKEVLLTQGHKISEKQVNALIKEVDMANDGTLGVEDIVGTMGIDLNRDDIYMMATTLDTLREQLSELTGKPIESDDQ